MFVTGEYPSAAQQVEVVADPFEQVDPCRTEEDGPPLAPQVQQKLLHDEDPLGLQPSEGFVEQQDPLAAHQRQDDAEVFAVHWIECGGLRVERHGKAAQQRFGIGRAVVAADQADAVAGRQPRPEAGIGLEQYHVARMERVAGLGDRARFGAQDAVDGLQQGAPALARHAVHGTLRQVHRHAVEQQPLSFADPQGINRNHGDIGSGCVRPAGRS